jgi:hypothetical protein
MSMAQVGGEYRKPTLHVLRRAVPLDHRLDGETVTKVVEARAAVDFSLPQTGPARKFVKGPSDSRDFQGAPEIGDEEGFAAAWTNERIAPLSIVTQGVDRGGMKRDKPRFLELAAADAEDSPSEVDFLIPQC